MEGVLHAYDPESGNDDVVTVGEAIGTVALCSDKTLLLALRNRLAFFDPDAHRLEHFLELEAGKLDNRANDGKVGPDGAFWIGTMSVKATRDAGSFYRVDPAGNTTTVLSPVSISNGLDWCDNWREAGMFYIDSFANRVERLVIDVGSAKVLRRTTFVEIREEEGLPDGMTLDVNDRVWVAIHNAGEVRCYSADRGLLAVVRLDTPLATCPAFGGKQVDQLFITAAGSGAGRDGGGLYTADVGVRGRLPYRFPRVR
jgi:sugar lactone lactonase YvrE